MRGYLAELDSALIDVPAAVRTEMVAGVREELSGLDAATAAARNRCRPQPLPPATAAARNRELGDPAFIAAEARAEVGAATPTAQLEAGWFPVVAAIVVAIGGAVIPVAGWIVGIGMVWASRTWFRWEKWVATLAAPVTGLLLSGLAWLLWLPQSGAESTVNPLVPTPHSLILSAILFSGLVNIAAGVWLLWRAKRTPRPTW
ncbi:MAG: HAAS signaling domain-containing protein [Rhodoglobus sp.]